jgi:hypothetical protein
MVFSENRCHFSGSCAGKNRAAFRAARLDQKVACGRPYFIIAAFCAFM